VTLTQPDLYPQYRVIWQNSGNSQTMWNWKCSPVSGVNAAAYTCNIEIADTALSAPASGASVSLPATFTWTRRATTGESYEVNFLDANHLYVGWSDSYPDTGQWTMASLTDLAFGALNTDVQYYWEMWVYGPTGYGIGYALRPLTFTPLGAAPALSGIPPAQPLPRSKLDALPEQPKRPQSPQNAP
jgi:hypothetical protein